jgi:hypothetical protein
MIGQIGARHHRKSAAISMEDLLSPIRRVVRGRSERCPRSIVIGTLASDADAIGTFLATVNLTAHPRRSDRPLPARAASQQRLRPATPERGYQGTSMPLRLSTSSAASDRRKLTSARAVSASFALVAIPAE